MSHLGELLSAHLDDEVTPEERTRIEAHLAGCSECSRELEDLDAARSAIRTLPLLDPPRGLVPRPAARAPWLRRRWVAAAGAIAAGALAVGLVTAPGERGPVFDMDTIADQHTARQVVDPGISTIRGPLGGP